MAADQQGNGMGKWKEKIAALEGKHTEKKLKVPGLINLNKMSVYTHHYTMVHAHASKCVCCVYVSVH